MRLLRPIEALLLLAMASGTLSAQGSADPPNRLPLLVGPSIALGSGPALTTAIGAGLTFELSRNVHLRGEVARFVQGLGSACSDDWPDSHRCSARPVQAMAGAGAVVRHNRLAVTADVLGGVHRVDDATLGVTAPAVRFEAGVHFDVTQRWLLGIATSYSTAFDRSYQDLMGERPEYYLVALTLRYRMWRR
jgi:hypothetical protein